MTRSQIAQRTGLSPEYITMLKQGDRGQRIGFSAYTALQRLSETSHANVHPLQAEGWQRPPPTRWTPPIE